MESFDRGTRARTNLNRSSCRPMGERCIVGRSSGVASVRFRLGSVVVASFTFFVLRRGAASVLRRRRVSPRVGKITQ